MAWKEKSNWHSFYNHNTIFTIVIQLFSPLQKIIYFPKSELLNLGNHFNSKCLFILYILDESKTETLL